MVRSHGSLGLGASSTANAFLLEQRFYIGHPRSKRSRNAQNLQVLVLRVSFLDITFSRVLSSMMSTWLLLCTTLTMLWRIRTCGCFGLSAWSSQMGVLTSLWLQNQLLINHRTLMINITTFSRLRTRILLWRKGGDTRKPKSRSS